MEQPEIPDEVLNFLKDLEANYEVVFMTMHISPCSACNGGKARLVHRGPTEHRLGVELRRLVATHTGGNSRG